MLKLYAYIDESGQDTEGRLFIVGVVITSKERDELTALCERIEREVGKRNKWSRSKDAINLAYIQQVIDSQVMQGKLFYAIYQNTFDYFNLTVETIEQAIKAHGLPENHQVVAIYDGLPRSLEMDVTNRLRKQGLKTSRVRGEKDEKEALLRLADAICGLLRGMNENETAMVKLFNQAIRRSIIQDVTIQSS